ncbi:unnamed protein product [Diabrotica balteata]|uniref:Sarcalumenin n=1 Tax=Diabrotica balteata TaxID=107213 RepID=A0A9N9SPI8_DIABA|nr:unnamed protein product [Diabrotica balteata]
MEVYRRSSGLVLLLGLFLLATTLQGVQGEVESEGPSESECRPYIEKALKELEAGEVAAGSSAEDGDGDSKEDIPTVEITDDSAHQEGDGEKDDTNEEGQDSNENVQTVSEKIEPEQDDASQEQQDEASVNDADRKDAEEDDEQKEDSKEDDTKPDEAVSAEDDGKDDASNEGDVEKADDKVSEDEESKEQQTDDNVSENEESKEQQAESEEEKADVDDSKEEVEAQQNADDSTEDDGAQQDESKEEQAQDQDKSEEHGDSLEERIEAEIIEHLTQSQAQIQDDESKEDEPAAQVEDQKESIEDQAQSDEDQAQSEEEQPKSTEDTQDTKDDDSKEDDGKDGESKEDEKSDTEDDKEASKEVTKDETDDDSKEDEHERHKRSIDDAQDDEIESKEEEAVLKEDASKEDDTNSKEDEAATKEEVDDKQEEADLKEDTAESKEDDVDSKEGTTEDADKSDEKEEPQSDEKAEDDKQDSAENKEDDQKDGDSKEDDAKSTEQDDKDDKDEKEEGKFSTSVLDSLHNFEFVDVKRDSREDNTDDKSAEVEKDSKEKDGGDSEENETSDDNKSAEDGAPVEELSFDTEIPSDLRPREHVEQLLKLDEQSSDTETVINRVSEITLRDLKKLYENAIKPLEVLYKYRDLSNRHFGDSEIFSKPLILFMGPWSGGKSSIINYLTNNEYNDTSLRTGAEPSPAYFNILMYGEEPEVIDGTELAADFTFSGLQKFGQGLEERLRGVKLPSKLLEKVNIVEIPGILEVRKQVSRVFPFNDACQWFIDRGDIIFLVYDPSKLDVGPETEAILDQLKGREHQTRIILNKADRVKPEELLRVQGALIWNISPLMSSPQPPIMYTTSLWSRPYEPWAPVRLLQAQERAFLRDLRGAVDKRIENKIASARRFAVRVRNHAKMVDCYLTTYYNHKSVFGNRKQVADAIIEHPQDYHIYEGLSTLTNISRYDLPDPDVYKDFFKLNPLYEFQQLSATCTYFRGCPINRLDIAIAYDLPELLGTHRKRVESALTEGQSGSQQQTSTPGS